jgi:L-aspartate oxidase
MGRVLVVTKKYRADTATNYARGGLAAIMDPEDSPDLHIRDTLVAGAGLCHREVVEVVVREGPARARELMEWGVRFHREKGTLSLAREGGHSRRRILHVGDRTGREIERALLAAVAEHPRIEVVENLLVVDLVLEEDDTGSERPSGGLPAPRMNGARRVTGAVALEHRTGNRVRIQARATLLATGGMGQVYRHTTNPPIATGDGIAMAYRAGASVANMEFVQFHPTALYPTEDPAFLLSEALRGEGAVLRRMDGIAFMDAHHPDGSLAPRDVVARAIQSELRRTGEDHVLLDVSPIPRALLEERFPGAVHGCRARGVDLEQGIPVVPAAHYLCGGVRSDLEGRSDLAGLWVCGEVACTGTHGANRLASNSLLEAVVFSHRAAASVRRELMGGEIGTGRVERAGPEERALPVEGRDPDERPTPIPEPGSTGAAAPLGTPAPGTAPAPGTDTDPDLGAIRRRLRSLMWEHAGIVRTDAGLEEAAAEVARLGSQVEAGWSRATWSVEGVELRNLLATAHLVLACARRRKESRGLHWNEDHPGTDDDAFLEDTVIRRPPGGP